MSLSAEKSPESNPMKINWVRENFREVATRKEAQSSLKVREKALEAFLEQGFPTGRDEDWKYTNLSPLTKNSFSLAKEEQISKEALSPFLIQGLDCYQMVFVNGHFASSLSSVEGLKDGVEISPFSALSELPVDDPKQVAFLRHAVSAAQTQALISLNTALVSDGVFVHIKKEKVLAKPLHVIFVTAGSQENVSTYTRVFVVSEEKSEGTVIESHVSLGNLSYFVSTQTECFLEENAKLTHLKIQEESKQSFHLANTRVYQKKQSKFFNTVFHNGGALVRNEIEAVLEGSECETVLNGLTLASGKQHIDNTTVIDHAKPHCLSTERYKGIYRDHAKGVFFGTIIVRQDAQKTNAIQSNNSLLLSENASIHTRPQLKIWADDVRCTHGATVGQLDEQALFYLRSRGIDKETAQGMLIEAFVSEVFDGLESESLRKHLTERLSVALATESI